MDGSEERQGPAGWKERLVQWGSGARILGASLVALVPVGGLGVSWAGQAKQQLEVEHAIVKEHLQPALEGKWDDPDTLRRVRFVRQFRHDGFTVRALMGTDLLGQLGEWAEEDYGRLAAQYRVAMAGDTAAYRSLLVEWADAEADLVRDAEWFAKQKPAGSDPRCKAARVAAQRRTEERADALVEVGAALPARSPWAANGVPEGCAYDVALEAVDVRLGDVAARQEERVAELEAIRVRWEILARPYLADRDLPWVPVPPLSPRAALVDWCEEAHSRNALRWGDELPGDERPGDERPGDERPGVESTAAREAADDAEALAACLLGARIDWFTARGSHVGRAARLTAAAAEFSRLCEGGFVEACADLGRALRYGEGVPRDAEKAQAAYQKGCDGGDPGGCNGLGWRLLAADPCDPKPALALFERACEAGHLNACDSVGTWHLTYGSEPPERVQERFRYACDLGEIRACLNAANVAAGASPDPFTNAAGRDALNCTAAVASVGGGR